MNAGLETSVVSRWFGAEFAALHPLLRRLHLHGGSLRGEVEIGFGRGVAGVIGRKLARSLGIPIDRPCCGFEVEIRHTAEALLWNRRFADGSMMRSVFLPIGQWPDGHWSESTGALRLDLGVDTTSGAWRWLPRRAYLHRIRLPLWLLPQTRAGKRIDGNRYVFHVEIIAPLIGTLLRYGGTLDPHAMEAR